MIGVKDGRPPPGREEPWIEIVQLKRKVRQLETERDELRDLIWWLDPNCPGIEKCLERMRRERTKDLEEKEKEVNDV